ncbi:MAG: cell wall hydrolase [Lachnospiraceae bacterium]|nr:cell wall hydrolase [Lachnospiraceae bacterium]
MGTMKIWKKATVLLLAALLAGTSVPVRVSATSATRDKIDKTEKEKDNLQNELDKTQDNLNHLEGQRDTLEQELAYLNGQMTEVVGKLADLEVQIKEKEQEIEDAQAALDEAKKTEEWQYISMVAIVRCMYEQQEENYLSMLLSVGSFSELLNRADYIEKTVAYEQKMLKEYQENRMLIEREESRLQSERIDLENLLLLAEAEKQKVSGLINQTANSITKYADQISDAEKKAIAYEEEIKKKEEDLEYLKKKLAEEIALSQAAANASWRDISEVSFAEGDVYLLANLIYCEAGGEPYAGKLGVGSVVINRVLSSKFPDSIVGVIYQSGQFSPVASGRLELALASNKANDECYRAAEEAMSGATNVGNCVFFRTPIPDLTGISIGGHIFY